MQALSLCVTIAALLLASPTHDISVNDTVEVRDEIAVVETVDTSEYEAVLTVTPVIKAMVTEPEEPVITMSNEDIELIALVTMAEAEGECEEGKRLVIDTILNRVDSELSYFPDTVHDVIYQKNAFSSMWNGRVDKCYVDDDICQLVREELISRTNYDVMYFTAGKYGKYGTPMFSVGNHYFSSN